MDIKRKCQICHTEYPLEEYYFCKGTSGEKTRICKRCNTIVANLSKFKKFIKTDGIDNARDRIENERLMFVAKENILSGDGINNVVRILLERGYK